jgi:D-aspartate ligase
MLTPAVILGDGAAAVSVARSLDAADVTVHVVGEGWWAARHSRACANFVDLGGAAVQDRWLAWLLGAGPCGAVILPCCDEGVELIARHRQALVERGYLPFAGRDRVMLDMLDKARTYELAREIGIPSPATEVVATDDDIEGCARRFAFPCALKPVHAHRFQRRSGTGVKAVVVRDAAELRGRFREMQRLGVEWLVTEIIPGGDDQLLGYHAYLDEYGVPLAEVTKRKLRQSPPGFGMGTYHVTERDPEAAALGLAFLRGIDARGLANVEFKRDARDGVLKLIECNHRFTATNELMRAAGVDLALLVYDDLLGRPTPRQRSFRTGVRLWEPIADSHAYLRLRGEGALSLADWVGSLLHPQHMPLFRWDDPMPALAHATRRVQTKVRRSRERSRGAAAPEPTRAQTHVCA